MSQPAMTREQLHDLAVRRGHDLDIRALLLEIKRLRGVVVRAYGCCCQITHYTENGDHAAARDWFIEALVEEPVVRELDGRAHHRPVEPDARELKWLAHRLRS